MRSVIAQTLSQQRGVAVGADDARPTDVIAGITGIFLSAFSIVLKSLRKIQTKFIATQTQGNISQKTGEVKLMKEFLERIDRATKLYCDNYDRVTQLTYQQPDTPQPQQPDHQPAPKPDYSTATLYELAQRGGQEWEAKLDQLANDAEI